MKGYKFPVYTTETCPRNETEWEARSAVFFCRGESSYACLPNENITELLEFCYPLEVISIHQGKLMRKLANNNFVFVNVQSINVYTHSSFWAFTNLRSHFPCIYCSQLRAQRLSCACRNKRIHNSNSAQRSVLKVNWN